MRKAMQRNQRGFTLIEVLIALLAAVAAISIPLVVLSVAGHGIARSSSAVKQAENIDGIEDQLRTSAETSVAIYTPSVCSTAGVAAAPHGDGIACNQIRFYGKDATGAAHYWGWEFLNGNVKECLSYAQPDAQCVRYGATINGVRKFTATPTVVGSIPVATQIGAASTASKEIEMVDTAIDPNARVVAGNRIVILDFATPWAAREVHLLQGGAPFSTATLEGTWTPPAIGTLTANPNPILFPSPTSPAGTVTATEPGYSKYTPYLPAPHWTITPCVNTAGIQLATVTFTGGPSPGVAGAADTQTMSVQPTGAGTCTYTISTQDQSVVETVNIYAVPGYTLVVTPPTPANILVSGTSTYNATALLNPPPPGTTYPGNPAPSIPVGISAETGTCTTVATGVNPAPVNFVTTGTAIGPCTLTITATPPGPGTPVINNNQIVTIGVFVQPQYALVVLAPVPNPINPGQTSNVTATALLSNAAQALPGSPPSVPITQLVDFSPSPCSFSGVAGSVYTYLGVTIGTCDVTFFAPQASPTSITVQIGVGGQACQVGYTGINNNCVPYNPCKIMRPTPNWYQLTPGTGTASPTWVDMMQAIANQDAIDSPGVVPNNNILYGYADNWPSTGNSIVKGAILMAQNTDCSISIMWPTASQKIQDSNFYREFRWDIPGAWGPSPTGAPYAPWIDASNQGMGEFETLCYGIGGTFDPQCPQPGGTSVVDGSSTDSFMHPQENRAVIANWDPGTTQLFKLKPDPTITVLPIPQIGHHIYNLTGNQQNYWQEGSDWMNNDGSPATQFCLILTCP